MRYHGLIAFALLVLLPVSGHAAECKKLRHEGAGYAVCEVDMARERLRLFLNNAEGRAYGFFSTLENALQNQGMRLGFAMNAGMYHEDRSPVGHYVENGEQQRGVISSKGPGNFGLLPNGVLCLRKDRADVFETMRYVREKPSCRDATQSGPMLVIDGELHPKFLKDSDSRYVRNGVGTSADGSRAFFVISDAPVTFHQFGSFFRDRLKLRNALYFDGNVSRLRAPDLGRNDLGFSPLGPIIGVVVPTQ